MAEHSKEPWIVGKPGEAYLDSLREGNRAFFIASPAFGNKIHHVAVGAMEADARRIVACVNVLADVPIEDLESGAFEDLLVEYGKYLVSRPAGQDRSAT